MDNTIIKIYNSEQEELHIKINDFKNLFFNISFKNFSEFKIFIEELLNCILILINKSQTLNEFINLHFSILGFQKFINNLFLNDNDKILTKNFKEGFISCLNYLVIDNEKLKVKFLNKNNTECRLNEIFFSIRKKVFDIINYLYNFQNPEDINKENLFQNKSLFFKVMSNYKSKKMSCVQKDHLENEKSIKLSIEDIQKIKKFINSLTDFQTDEYPAGFTWISNKFILADSQSIVFTLIGSDNEILKTEFGTIKIDDNTFIDLDKNKIMYNILKKMINSKNFTYIYPVNMSNKIDIFNFYYKNPYIIDLYINLKKNFKFIKLGDYFNILEFKYSDDYNKIILGNYSEIDKFKDELLNPKTICYLFFNEVSTKYFLKNYNIFEKSNIIIEIYPGIGKIKKEMEILIKKITEEKEKSCYIQKKQIKF